MVIGYQLFGSAAGTRCGSNNELRKLSRARASRVTNHELGLSFNGSWPTYEAKPTDQLLFPIGPFDRFGPAYQGFNYRLNAGEIKEGWNEIVVYHGTHDPVRSRERNETARIASIELAVM